jgi:TolB protein
MVSFFYLRSALFNSLCAAVILCSPCFAGEEADEVVVLLGSEHALLPTHVEQIEANSTDLSRDFLSKIEKVLDFDLNYNGMTRVVEGKEKEAAQQAEEAGFDSPLNLEALRKIGLSYLIRWKASNHELNVKVVQVASGTVRTISPISLTGDLSKDRSRIHQLADSIHQALFGKSGIANTKILYVLKKRDSSEKSEPITTSEIYEADYDGQNARQLTHTNSLCATPCWVPPRTPGIANAEPSSGQRSQTFLYVSYELGQPKIYAASLRDAKVYRVTTMRGNQLTPAVASDGSSVAFCSDITGTADLYLVPFESGVGAVGKPRQIFHVKGTATACPTFSPDGSKIAFVSNKDGSAKIYVMDIPKFGAKSTDLHPKLISKRCRESTAPYWSPDGKKIAYSAKNGGERQIWIYDVERGTEQQLTDGRGNKESPSWAPDSLHLVFHAFTGSGCELYMVNLNQPKPVKISSGPWEKLFPAWESKPLG